MQIECRFKDNALAVFGIQGLGETRLCMNLLGDLCPWIPWHSARLSRIPAEAIILGMCVAARVYMQNDVCTFSSSGHEQTDTANPTPSVGKGAAGTPIFCSCIIILTSGGMISERVQKRDATDNTEQSCKWKA